jgi:arylsulfatase A-like enzyme
VTTTRQWNRREITQAGAMLAAAPLLGGSVANRPGVQPNIVFILADDLGYADVGCYGRTEYATPAIDRLAREGMRFTQAYANSAVCSATRTGLITGRYQNRLAIGLEEPLAGRDIGLPPSHPTLPSLLRRAGYGTTLIGKWHLGQLPKYGPLQSGYDHFWGFRGGELDYFTHCSSEGAADLWDDDRPIRQPGYLTDLIGQRAIAAIDGYYAARRPFFLSVHFNAPHWPWEGPADIAESRRIEQGAKGFLGAYDVDGGSMKAIAGMVTRMDTQIAALLQRLEDHGIADQTIVIFTSDNGGERYSNTWPFTGKKTELLEGGLRIPAIARWPGRIAPGAISDQVMISMDWLPTLLSLAGGEPDPAFPSDGMDLRGVLSGQTRPVPRTLCWRYLNLMQEACRIGDWKYLKILGNSFLFNVVEDPLERANMKDREPARYAHLVEAYRSWDRLMLPLDPKAMTGGMDGGAFADHFGVTSARTVPID